MGALLNITDAWEMGVCSDVWRLFLIMRSLQCAAEAICSHLQACYLVNIGVIFFVIMATKHSELRVITLSEIYLVILMLVSILLLFVCLYSIISFVLKAWAVAASPKTKTNQPIRGQYPGHMIILDQSEVTEN